MPPISQEARAAHKAKLAERKAAFVAPHEAKNARMLQWRANNADKIEAQRAAFHANHAAQVQKLATTRAGVLRVAPTASPFDIFKLRNRGFANTVQGKIAALKRAAQ